MHSPFVFEFISKVLNDQKKYPCYDRIESARKELLRDKTMIEVEDFGAGSAVIKTNARRVNKIAASSLKPAKYAQLLFRIVQFYQPATIVELGTSFGISTAYLSSGNEKATVYTLEGAASIAGIAGTVFKKLSLDRVTLLQGDFAQTMPLLFQKLTTTGLAFVDGNHRKEPTLQYFHELLQRSDASTILIFDDIHWSAGMEAAWEEIRQHPSVTLSIDLFFIGLVFFDPCFKVKQHFIIQF